MRDKIRLVSSSTTGHYYAHKQKAKKVIELKKPSRYMRLYGYA